MIKAILFFLIAVFFALLTSIFILKKANDNQFKKICKIYCDKYKELPVGVSVLYNSGPFTFSTGYLVKMGFIVNPLIFGRPSSLSTNKEDVQFMRSLDAKLTSTFKLEFLLCNIALVDFISLWGIVYFFGE